MTLRNFYWLCAGMSLAELIGLLTKTTPEQAVQNLHDWWQLIRWMVSQAR